MGYAPLLAFRLAGLTFKSLFLCPEHFHAIPYFLASRFPYQASLCITNSAYPKPLSGSLQGATPSAPGCSHRSLEIAPVSLYRYLSSCTSACFCYNYSFYSPRWFVSPMGKGHAPLTALLFLVRRCCCIRFHEKCGAR